jgi:hypothetical protein
VRHSVDPVEPYKKNSKSCSINLGGPEPNQLQNLVFCGHESRQLQPALAGDKVDKSDGEPTGPPWPQALGIQTEFVFISGALNFEYFRVTVLFQGLLLQSKLR